MHFVGAATLIVGTTTFLGLRCLPAQDPTDPRVDLAALRAERDKLRAELLELRKQVQNLAPGLIGKLIQNDQAAIPSPETPPPTDPRVRRQHADTTRNEGRAARPSELTDSDLVNVLRTRDRVEPRAETARGGDNQYAFDLLTRSIDLDADIQVLSHRLKHQEGLRAGGLAPEEDVVQTKAKLEACQRKREVVAGLLDGERQATEREIDVLRQQIELTPRDSELQIRLVRAQARLRVLRESRK
jgi:hypothetical protein